MNIRSYKSYLSRHGRNEAEIKRNQSDFNIDKTFTRDPNYKKVYLLSQEGWKYEDVKYQFHVAGSILKDAVDYYLQFRPKIHYPIGTYVIIPDDTSPEIQLSEEELKNPFNLPEEKMSQLWMIVGRDNANAYVRYNVLKCNWLFKWIYKGKINKCWGAIRNANSYTSGIWRDEISVSLDNLTAAWMPDIHYVYGDKCVDWGLDDNRTIMHDNRFLISNNIIDPKVYKVTKIVDLVPQGIIKYSIKQDGLNRFRDNINLGLCDYYTDDGTIQVIEPVSSPEPSEKISTITRMFINANNELVENDGTYSEDIILGTTSYFKVDFSTEGIDPEWRVHLEDPDGQYSDKDKLYYEQLIKVNEFDRATVAIRPAKAYSLIGKSFNLCVSDLNGEYHSSIALGVIRND